MVWLSSCSTPLPPPSFPALTDEQRVQQLLSFTHWQAQGRLAVTKGTQGGNASFLWEQRGENYRIRLWGPFGAHPIYIEGNSQGVRLHEQGKIKEAHSPELLLQNLLGWTVPVSGLETWLKGLPLPTLPVHALKKDDQHRLVSFQQQGWHIQYDAYQATDPLSLPTKLFLQSDSLRVKIMVKTWQRLPA